MSDLSRLNILSTDEVIRLINENLYKTDSREAHQLMRDDPRIYEQVSLNFTPVIYVLNEWMPVS